MQGFFLPNSLFILVSHAVAGLWTAHMFRLYLMILPLCFLAIPLGSSLAGRMNRSRFELFTMFVLLFSGVLLVLN